jgi:8-oxo-dGTP pyrophosphatase MutT (NUDIX family)
MGYIGSRTWQLRQFVGTRLLLMPGSQVRLVDPAERILFQQRKDSGLWEIPAGAAEPGSTFASTAASEVREETGRAVAEEHLTPFGCLSDPGVHLITYPNGDQMHCFALCFEARRWSGTVEPENAEVMDIAFADMATPPGPLQPPTKVVLTMYAEFRRTGCFQAR